MKKVIEAIENSEKKVYMIGNVNEAIIKDAEEDLGFDFQPEIKQFIKEYGSISVGSIEIFGLGVKENSHLNIVSRTKEILSEDKINERNLVIEDLGDAHYAVYNNSGVYELAENKMIKKISDSFEDYLHNRIKDENK